MTDVSILKNNYFTCSAYGTLRHTVLVHSYFKRRYYTVFVLVALLIRPQSGCGLYIKKISQFFSQKPTSRKLTEKIVNLVVRRGLLPVVHHRCPGLEGELALLWSWRFRHLNSRHMSVSVGRGYNIRYY
jgi:hypothetical protein